MNKYYMAPTGFQQDPMGGGMSRLSPSYRQRLMSQQPQNRVIAPLDLAYSEPRPPAPELTHLSPVYETRTPSPVVARKFENTPKLGQSGVSGLSKTDDKAAVANAPKANVSTEPKSEPKNAQKIETKAQPPKAETKAEAKTENSNSGRDATKPSKSQGRGPQNSTKPHGRENGHVRGAKSESDGTWHKAGKGKKKAPNGAQQTAPAEQPPKHESERKGG
jgi:hypothetical protein